MSDASPEVGDGTRPLDAAASPPSRPAADAEPQAQEAQDASSSSPEAVESATGGAAADAKPEEAVESTEEDDEDDDVEEEGDDDDDEDDDDEDDDEEPEEPRLKYTRLTQHLGAVYKNGDATSSFLVAGDKMIVGTHSGNIHVMQLPTFQSLFVYHAHSASVTSLSISPFPPPLSVLKPDAVLKAAALSGAGSPLRPASRHSKQSDASPAAVSRKPKESPAVPNIPSNNIYIATSSMDGNVCVQSLIDRRDVQLRNFARPVQTVALSPDYKNDRTYLSGGLAGNLILTVGGHPGKSNSTTIGTAAATASGWLGTIGLGGNAGKDTILHSGEGTISSIKWSLSGKYVVWLNEHGIKIMRAKIKLESADLDDAWKRIGHIDRPQTAEWDAMASAWKGRAEWIDEQAVDSDDGEVAEPKFERTGSPSPAAEKLKQQQSKHDKSIEKLVVGWGGTIWVIHVHPGGMGVGKHVGERSIGRAEIHQKLRMDCLISGISLYTQNLLLVLAYCLPNDEDEEEDEGPHTQGQGNQSKPSTASGSSEPSGGIRRRQNNQPPELRLIDLGSQSEVYKDGLSMSRYERLSASDYHLGVLPASNAAAVTSSKGALEALAGFGTDMWNAAINPKMLFSSGASIMSSNSNDASSATKAHTVSGSIKGMMRMQTQAIHPSLDKPGTKIFIHSPYDCILSTKRDLGDHLVWLLERQEYQKAWELVDEHPEIMATVTNLPELPPSTPTADRSGPTTQSSDDFFDDSASVVEAASRVFNSSAAKEKRRIGELWMQELVEEGDWVRAGQVAAKVLGSADRWEKWIWTFAGADKFDEIANYMPTEPMRPPIKTSVYEVVLGHYIKEDKPRFRELLDRWPTDLFDINTITTALENQLNYRDVRESSVEDGEKGRDWRIVMESLARLHEANGRHREALRCHIRLQDADSAFRLIRERHLADAVADNIPSFINLRVPAGMENKMKLSELEEATADAITLLVDEAQHGLVKPEIVVSQLREKDLNTYLFFYLRGLWSGDGIQQQEHEMGDRLRDESRSLVDDFADLAVHLFASYDRALLMEFLKKSLSYSYERAASECESYNYIPELVYLYAKTGQMKRALYLIIDRLGDVSRAIAFAKTQDDPDLWEDLLNYSMDKPRFIRGLLEEVGTAIDPITLVRRIPQGLEVPGLREGLTHIMKEHEIQHSISSGVARVLRSEVSTAQATLRGGQRRGVKFEVAAVSQNPGHLHIEPKAAPAATAGIATPNGVGAASALAGEGDSVPAIPDPSVAQPKEPEKGWSPGHCAVCFEAFTEWEVETLVGFACGHVFHLSHLLETLNPGGHQAEAKQANGDGPWVGERANRRRQYVGSKVTHARLLRDKIQGGCPVCPRKSKEMLLA
ncbi:hypothetical protein RB597_001206 [Gaeumannomyces tritici]